MAALALDLIALVLGVTWFVSWIFLIVQARKVSLGWAAAVLFFWPSALVFGVKHRPVAGRIFLVWLIATILFIPFAVSAFSLDS